MASYRMISSDSHVDEPSDLWTERMEPRFRDRAPHVISQEDGDYWYCEGLRMLGAGASAEVGMRFDEPEKLSLVGLRAAERRPGGFIPEEAVKDMDIDGVDVSITYPTAGLLLFMVPDSELVTAMFAAYNNWLADFCSAAPKRLKGIGMLNVDDIPSSIKELERCANLGLVGALIAAYPLEGREYFHSEYDPLWAAAQDLGMPLSLHVVTNRPKKDQGNWMLDFTPSFVANYDHWVRMSLGDIIFSGVFERYPKLQMGTVEHELSWIPHFLDRLDYTYTQRPPYGEQWHRYKEDMLPSDYFHRNCFAGFQEDALGIKDRYIIGVDNLQWGSDYPHLESTFPRSRQILEEVLADCTEEEKVKIAAGNAARVYRID